MSTTTTLAAWRAARTSQETLPSGLLVTLRKVHLLDLAAQGQIPAPLVGQVEQLMQASAGPQALGVADFPRHAAVIDLVVRAALVDPPVADEPDEAHISLAELPFGDRIHIFNWAQGEAAQVATFPEPGAGPGPRTPRGRPRVRAAAEPAAEGQLGGLADRPGGAGPGDAGEPAAGEPGEPGRVFGIDV